MNVARINCAHDDQKVWKGIIKNVRKAENEINKKCKILMDIASPKSRVSWIFTGENINRVKVDDYFILTGNKNIKTDGDVKLILGCSLPEAFKYLEIGHSVLIDDGIVEGRVVEKNEEGILV